MLTTVDECQTAIEIITAEKTQLERRLRNLSERLEGQTERSVEISQGIAASKAILQGFQAAVAVIPEQKLKRDFELKIEREETKLKSLENRQANYSIISLIEDQIDYTQLEVQIPELTNAIAKIEERKAAL